MTSIKDGTLNFGNTLRANAYNSNSIIFTSNAVNINLGCSYATHYDDIELTTTVVGSDVSTDTEGPVPPATAWDPWRQGRQALPWICSPLAIII